MTAADFDGERFGLQAIAFAGGARGRRHVAANLLARPFAFCFEVAALEILDDAFEGLLHVISAQTIVVRETDRLFIRAVKDHVLRLFRQVLEWCVHAELVVLAECFKRLLVIWRRGARPRRDRALAQRLFRIGDDEIGIDALL